jgi:hypothetical protein
MKKINFNVKSFVGFLIDMASVSERLFHKWDSMLKTKHYLESKSK